jgi:nucleoside-diphosphate-sugar epimerase
VTRSVPVWLAYAAGAALEVVFWVLRRTDEPPMTRFLALQLSTAHWYDISAARRDLGYEPSVTIDQGLELLAASLSDER